MADIRRRAAEEARKRVAERNQAAAERQKDPSLKQIAKEREAAVEESSSKSSFGWKKAQPSGQDRGDQETSAQAHSDDEDLIPTDEECALGIQHMIDGTLSGMREGLELLGLPNDPVYFTRGRQLRLHDHDIRSEVNDLIHEWMTENRDEFRKLLSRLQEKAWSWEARMEWEQGYHADEGQGPVGGEGGGWGLEESHDSAASDDDASATKRQGRPVPPKSSAAFRPAMAENLYKFLGVEPDAAMQEIRARFRSLVLGEHPDRGGNPERFEKLGLAYTILSHQKLRVFYDAVRASQQAGSICSPLVDPRETDCGRGFRS